MSDFVPRTSPRDAYKPLLEAMAGDSDLREDLSIFAQQVAIDAADENLPEYLARLGFRKFAAFAEGSSAIILDTTEGQILRIHCPNGDKRAKVMEEIQPIVQFEGKYLVGEILPKLCSSEISQEYDAFTRHVRSKGYYESDLTCYRGDLGYLPDGTLIGIDKNAIEGAEEPAPFDAGRDAAWVMKSDQTSIFPELQGTGYISKQEHFFPALVDGRVRGILSDTDKVTLEQGGLEILRGEKPECFEGIEAANLAPFMQLVFDEGWYPAQAQEIMRERDQLMETPDTNITGTKITGVPGKDPRGRD